ncbi:hypothetical protein KJ359_005868 [Pestalotiopsis sp. 9143b]|nr:hypothetical protein KJ359_005868 [Pestalotiopsis sp. 9143b]
MPVLKQIWNLQGLIWKHSQVTKTLKTEIETKNALCLPCHVRPEEQAPGNRCAPPRAFKNLHDYRDAPGWTELHQKALEETGWTRTQKDTITLEDLGLLDHKVIGACVRAPGNPEQVKVVDSHLKDPVPIIERADELVAFLREKQPS